MREHGKLSEARDLLLDLEGLALELFGQSEILELLSTSCSVGRRGGAPAAALPLDGLAETAGHINTIAERILGSICVALGQPEVATERHIDIGKAG